MTTEEAAKLRAPFKPAQIGKLPKPTKRDNPKGKCPECGGYHGLPAVHLDYVGHAAVTDRLLQVDPEWSWKPMAVSVNGEPLFTNGGLWIELTVCGVTRPGFGDEGNGKGTKEVIGDAIRNAAMRFGVALDLWAKEDLSADDESAGEPSAGGITESSEAGAGADADASSPAESPFKAPSGKRGAGDVDELAKKLVHLVSVLGATDSLPKIEEKREAGDAAWLKRQIKTAQKAVDKQMEGVPF